MLLGLVISLSLMAAVLLCAGTGAFDTFAFLWLLPVSLVGSFLLLVALGFADMWLGIFADVGVMVLAVLNAMRALRAGKED